jgi:hypothetical protein
MPDTDCSPNLQGIRDIDLIPAYLYPGVPQQAEDMGAVASNDGLFFHRSPIINDFQFIPTLIPWESSIVVESRFVLVDNAGEPFQIWYETTYESEEGWVAARIGDRFYVETAFPNVDPCVDVAAPDEITFTYERWIAARYAVEHSYQNITQNPGEYRVTRRIESSPLPFANFEYSELATGTGSAMFVSEAIWMGGMPMTVGEPDSCGVAHFVDSGWRYCWSSVVNGQDVSRTSSTAWRVHKGLGEYYTNATLPSANPIESSNSILADKGQQLQFVDIIESDRLVATDISSYIGPVDYGGNGFDIDELGISNFSRQHLGQLQAGDYMFINSYDPTVPPEKRGDYHGLMVVGWYSPMDCESAFELELSPNAFDISASDTSLDTAMVPWVADFTSVQQPLPRPFYCTRYLQAQMEDFVAHDWYFYTLPDEITIGVDQIYADPNWDWSPNDG